MRRYATGQLSAKDVCEAASAVHGHGLGVADLVNSSQRNHQRTLDRALDLDRFVEENVYYVDVPVYNHRLGARTVRKHPLLLVHERVAAIARADPAAFHVPEESRDGILGLPRIRDCTLLQEHGWPNVALLGMYSDAAPWSRTDSFIALYWNNVFDRRRQLITLIRKKDLCGCGCRGRCSMQALLSAIVWSFNCLRAGQFPRRRHDGSPLDARRVRLHGPLPLRGALIEFRADWAELAACLGFRTWASPACPCFACSCTSQNMHMYNANENEQPYQLVTMQSYMDSVRAATLTVRVGRMEARALEANLDGSRCLQADMVVDGVALRAAHGDVAADRLEIVESGGLRRDTHVDLRTLGAYPLRLVFFRADHGQRIVAPNVLFDILDIGSIALDVLHSMDLGVSQYAAGWALTMILLADSYDTGCTTQEQLLARGVRAMFARLLAWYRDNRRFGRVSFLTVGMIVGTNHSVYRPCVRAKGAESKGLLFFARDELHRFADTIATTACRTLVAALDNLCSYYDLMGSAGRVCSPTQVQQLLRHAINHNMLFKASGGCLAPKHHLWVHLTRQFVRNGNMRYGSTYPDETLNGTFAKVCRSTHPSTLPVMCMKKYFLLRGLEGQVW